MCCNIFQTCAVNVFTFLSETCRKFFPTSERVFRRNPASFLNNVFNSVNGNEELFEIFVSTLKKIGVDTYEEDTMKDVCKKLLVKICRTRVKVFMQSMGEKDMEKRKKVCDVDSSLRDKLKGYVLAAKRE